MKGAACSESPPYNTGRVDARYLRASVANPTLFSHTRTSLFWEDQSSFPISTFDLSMNADRSLTDDHNAPSANRSGLWCQSNLSVLVTDWTPVLLSVLQPSIDLGRRTPFKERAHCGSRRAGSWRNWRSSRSLRRATR